jgi:DNA replication protein DnaC
VLLDEEVAGRERSALATWRTQAAFPTGKTLATWDTSLSSIPAPTQTALRTLEWIGWCENLEVCGPSGSGKTFFLEALGQLAVEAGLKVAWFSLEDLAERNSTRRSEPTVIKRPRLVGRASSRVALAGADTPRHRRRACLGRRRGRGISDIC